MDKGRVTRNLNVVDLRKQAEELLERGEWEQAREVLKDALYEATVSEDNDERQKVTTLLEQSNAASSVANPTMDTPRESEEIRLDDIATPSRDGYAPEEAGADTTATEPAQPAEDEPIQQADAFQPDEDPGFDTDTSERNGADTHNEGSPPVGDPFDIPNQVTFEARAEKQRLAYNYEAQGTFNGYQQAVNLWREILPLCDTESEREHARRELERVDALFNRYARIYGELRTAQALNDLKQQLEAIDKLIRDGIAEGPGGEPLYQLNANLIAKRREAATASALRRKGLAEQALEQAWRFINVESAGVAIEYCDEVLSGKGQPDFDASDVEEDMKQSVREYRELADQYRRKIQMVRRLVDASRGARRAKEYNEAESILREAVGLAGSKPHPLFTDVLELILQELQLERLREDTDRVYSEVEQLRAARDFRAAETRLEYEIERMEAVLRSISSATDATSAQVRQSHHADAATVHIQSLRTLRRTVHRERVAEAIGNIRRLVNRAEMDEQSFNLETALDNFTQAALYDKEVAAQDDELSKLRQYASTQAKAITEKLKSVNGLLEQADRLRSARNTNNEAVGERALNAALTPKQLDETIELVNRALQMWPQNARGLRLKRELEELRPEALLAAAARAHAEIEREFYSRPGYPARLQERLEEEALEPIRTAEGLLRRKAEGSIGGEQRQITQQLANLAELRSRLASLHNILTTRIELARKATEQHQQALEQLRLASENPAIALTYLRQANSLFEKAYKLDAEQMQSSTEWTEARRRLREELVQDATRLLAEDPVNEETVQRHIDEIRNLGVENNLVARLHRQFKSTKALQNAQRLVKQQLYADAISAIETVDAPDRALQALLSDARIAEAKRLLKEDPEAALNQLKQAGPSREARSLMDSAYLELAKRHVYQEAYAGRFLAAREHLSRAYSSLSDDPEERTRQRAEVRELDTWLQDAESRVSQATQMLQRAGVHASRGTLTDLLEAVDLAGQALDVLREKHFALYKEAEQAIARWRRDHLAAIEPDLTKLLEEAQAHEVSAPLKAADLYQQILRLDQDRVVARERLQRVQLQVQQLSDTLIRQAEELIVNRAVNLAESQQVLARLREMQLHQPKHARLAELLPEVEQMVSTLDTIERMLDSGQKAAAQGEIPQARIWLNQAQEWYASEPRNYMPERMNPTSPNALEILHPQTGESSERCSQELWPPRSNLEGVGDRRHCRCRARKST